MGKLATRLDTGIRMADAMFKSMVEYHPLSLCRKDHFFHLPFSKAKQPNVWSIYLCNNDLSTMPSLAER